MRVSAIQHQITYIKIHNNNHRQENTGQSLERKRFRSTKSNRTDPTKHIRPSEQKKYHTGNTKIKLRKRHQGKTYTQNNIHQKIRNKTERDQTNEIAEIVAHQIKIRTINLHLENRYDIIVKKTTFRENMQILEPKMTRNYKSHGTRRDRGKRHR